MKLIILVLIVAAALSAWIRLAPTSAQDWHAVDMPQTNKRFRTGAARIIPAETGTFAALDAIIAASPRTMRIAGSVDSGKITYQTRSLIWGFPDYTTLEEQDGVIRIYGRLRYGQSDLGVNARRIDRWLKRLAETG